MVVHNREALLDKWHVLVARVDHLGHLGHYLHSLLHRAGLFDVLGFDHFAVDDGLDLGGDHSLDALDHNGGFLDNLSLYRGLFGFGGGDLAFRNLLVASGDLVEDGWQLFLLDDLWFHDFLVVGLGHSVDLGDDHLSMDDILGLSLFARQNGFLNYRSKLSLFEEDLLPSSLRGELGLLKVLLLSLIEVSLAKSLLSLLALKALGLLEWLLLLRDRKSVV